MGLERRARCDRPGHRSKPQDYDVRSRIIPIISCLEPNKKTLPGQNFSVFTPFFAACVLYTRGIRKKIIISKLAAFRLLLD